MDEDAITFGRRPDPLDRVSLREIFDASYRTLVVQLYGVTGSLDDAEDLVQESFVRAAASGRRFLSVDNPEAWLRTTAVNAHRSRWRKLRNGRRAQERLLPPPDPAGLEDHLELIAALRALPNRNVMSSPCTTWPTCPSTRSPRSSGCRPAPSSHD